MLKDGEYGEYYLLTISVLAELWQLLFDKNKDKKSKETFPSGSDLDLVLKTVSREKNYRHCSLKHTDTILKQTVPTYSLTQLLAWCILSSKRRKEKNYSRKQLCTLIHLLSFSCFQYFCVAVLHTCRHGDCPRDEDDFLHSSETDFHHVKQYATQHLLNGFPSRE